MKMREIFDTMKELRTDTQAAIPAKEKTKVGVSRLSLSAIGYAIIDSYGHSLLSLMFPEIAQQLHLSLAQVGALPMILNLESDSQQRFNFWFDKGSSSGMLVFKKAYEVYSKLQKASPTQCELASSKYINVPLVLRILM